MSLRTGVQSMLLSAYKTANKVGLLESPLAEGLFRRSYFAYKALIEDPFARLIKHQPALFRGGDILDVGANIGYTAALFARAVAPPYRVHAFEPEQRNFRWLEHTIERGKLGDHVVAHRAAVGAREGTIDLWYNAAHHADHRIATSAQQSGGEQLQQVPMTTIDHWVAGAGGAPVAFVKIDVQGFEHEVLRGMRATLANNRACHVAVEFAPAALTDLGFDPEAFLADLAAALPRMAILDHDGRLRDAAPAEILAETARGRGYLDLVCAT